MKALVIGGTGPTGPYLINGLVERGYEVAMLTRGTHDSPLIPASVERIVGDPHFRETLRDALGDRRFDLVVATYGRIRYIAAELVGRTPRLVAIGGPPSYKGMFVADSLYPPGMIIPTPEDAPRVESEEEFRFGYLIRATEDVVFDHHARGDYNATMFRYPMVYAEHPLASTIWPVMERVLDGREHIVLPDGGHIVLSRGYAANMAHAVLLAVDQPEVSAGKIYNCGDLQQFTLAQWVRLISDAMGASIEVIGIPAEIAYSARELVPLDSTQLHQLLDLHAVRAELGYRDQVPALEAVPKVVRWFLENPLARRGGRAEDPLNYEAEDRQVAIYREVYGRLAEVPHYSRAAHHPYPHPKEPGLDLDHRKR